MREGEPVKNTGNILPGARFAISPVFVTLQAAPCSPILSNLDHEG